MKKTTKVLALAMLTLFGTYTTVSAQKKTSEKITFKYIQLPSIGVSKSIKTFTPAVKQDNQEELARRKEELDGAWEQKIVAWETETQIAQSNYDKEMEVYNSKGVGTKLLEKSLIGDSKPVLRLPTKPTRNYEDEPYVGKVFSTDELASSYLKIDGFSKASSGGLQYTVTITPFQGGSAEMQTKSKRTKQSDGTYKNVNTYYYSVKYRQPLHVKISTPSGEELFAGVVPSTEGYGSANGPSSSSQYTAKNSFNRNEVLNTAQTTMIASNMKKVNEFVNDKFGYAQKSVSTKLYNVKPKKYDYKDYQGAFRKEMAALRNLTFNEADAQAKLKEASATWKTILEERDLDNKKARINKKLTEAICENAWYAALLSYDFEGCQNVINILYELEPSKREKKKIGLLEEQLGEAKLRFAAQKD